MLFGRKKPSTSAPSSVDAPSSFGSKSPLGSAALPAATDASIELAKDTVAALLRTLAEYALPTAAFPSDQFTKRCESLARSVLIKSEIDETTGKPVREDRVHADVRQTVRNQRKAESSEYSKHRESAHIIVSDLVTTLKRSLELREGMDQEIVGLLSEMQNVVDKGDLSAIRRVSSKTADHIRDIIAVQREQDQEQLAKLSSQLRVMREELAEAQAQMQRDPLTELLNRGAFDEAFEKTVTLSHASAADLTLFMVDLDRFKNVNDAYGHQAGDAVLKAVSRQLIRCFPRKDDLVVRFGGEEFAVLCRNTGINEGAMLGERLRQSVERLEIELADLMYHPTASVGFAVLHPNESAQSFLKRADDALYAAKKAGRNLVKSAER
jgi:diguanylate cyclase